MAFASLASRENIWAVSIDANHPRAGGTLEPVTRESGFQTFASVSNDATKALISHAAYNDEVWLQDMHTGKRSLLSTATSTKFKPVIDADGSRVSSTREAGHRAIYAVPSAGGTPEKVCEACGWPWKVQRTIRVS